MIRVSHLSIQPDITLAVEIDTNPKRQRGRKVGPSLAFRVSMDCANLNRMRLKNEKRPPTFRSAA